MKYTPIVLVLSVLATSAFASAPKPLVECRPYEQGWQTFNSRTGRALGRGYFYDLRDCSLAVAAQKNRFVCAADSGGAIVADLRGDVRAGNGFYALPSICNQAVQGSKREGVVCGAQNGGTVMYSRFASGPLGNGYFVSLRVCQNALDGSMNRVFCGAQNGGAAMFTIEGRQLGGGYWADVATCTQATQFTRSGYLCVPDAGQVRLAELSSGNMYGYYSRLSECHSALSRLPL